MKDWQRFVLAHGWKAHAYELAAVVGQPLEEIQRFKTTRACSKLKKLKRFAELFALWHGRSPRDDEWPAPRKARHGGYEWQAPELALLASLVGRIGKPEISKILTARLRKRAGSARAKRSINAVQMYMGRLGLVTTDVIGGITLEKAAKETGAYYNIWNAIKRKELRAFRIGRLWTIPHGEWEKWKASRVFPPKGYVQLSTLKRPLGIRSDKLSEWARMGYVPSALRCNPFGTRAKLTKFGTWYVDPAVAKKLISDRRAGRPMPWWGKPEPGNLQVTWRLLQKRQHPPTCATCAQIWGPKGAPRAWDDYVLRYPPLAHGAKRHLTRPWSPGMTIAEVAAHTGRSWTWVRRAIDNGTLSAERTGSRYHVQRAAATHWKARHCPAGSREASWLSLASASLQHQFTQAELQNFIKQGRLHTKVGTNGPMRGITYVPRHQVRRLRETIGFSEDEAARRVGVRVSRLRVLLKGVHWRGIGAIPLDTVSAVIRRRYSQDGGDTIEEAAAKLGKTVEWIHERVLDGTIRLMRGKWDRRRLYVSAPMFQRLEAAKRKPDQRVRLNADWLFIGQAAREAGVSTGTITHWVDAGDLERRQTYLGWRYLRKSVRARARRYWQEEIRFRRATPPEWFPTAQMRVPADRQAMRAGA